MTEPTIPDELELQNTILALSYSVFIPNEATDKIGTRVTLDLLELTKLIQTIEKNARAELFNLYGTPVCENLHHPKKYQHKGFENCPVVERITQLEKGTFYQTEIELAPLADELEKGSE